ncbi:hypothetical protein ACXX9E_28560 [Pseudomonas sp. GNP014]
MRDVAAAAAWADDGFVEAIQVRCLMSIFAPVRARRGGGCRALRGPGRWSAWNRVWLMVQLEHLDTQIEVCTMSLFSFVEDGEKLIDTADRVMPMPRS